MIDIDFLKVIPLFTSLADEDLEDIASTADVLYLSRDAYICREGGAADAMFVIKSGIVQVFRENADGERCVLSHLKLGDCFGEMGIFTGDTRSASCIALAETEVIQIGRDKLLSLMVRRPSVALGIIKTLCQRLTKANLGLSGQKIGSSKNFVFSVMGPDISSGKSLLARNLAASIQQAVGEEVLLFDPNMRNDRIARMLGVEERSEIVDELASDEKISDIKKYIAKTDCGLLTVIPQKNGLTDTRFKEFHAFTLIHEILKNFSYIVVDSSSMFTKVTHEIVQNSDKLIYLISSKNISVGGLIEHFDNTIQEWKLSSDKVVYGINHLTSDPSQESIVTAEDHKRLFFEIPYTKEFVDLRGPLKGLTVQNYPESTLGEICKNLAEALIFDHQFNLYVPAFSSDPDKNSESLKWFQSAVQELSPSVLNLKTSYAVEYKKQISNVISWKSSKRNADVVMVKVSDFVSKFKKHFKIESMILMMNGTENLI